MIDNEIKRSSKKDLVKDRQLLEVKNIKAWLRDEYPLLLAIYGNSKYLNLPVERTRYDIEIEAYQKRQRLNELEGNEPLPELKINNIL